METPDSTLVLKANWEIPKGMMRMRIDWRPDDGRQELDRKIAVVVREFEKDMKNER